MTSKDSLPTLFFPKSIFSDDFRFVYEPAEDSFLLLDALEKDLVAIRETTSICLECGSGSGLIITSLSKTLNSSPEEKNHDNPRSNVLMIATDINERACKTTSKCAKLNSQDILVINTNFADGLVDRLTNRVDLLIFNPPYVPTHQNELSSEKDNKINLSWAGGPLGRDILDRFLKSYAPCLLSKPNGRLYIVALDQNNVEDLLSLLVNEYGIRGEIVMERRCGIEKLYVLRFSWIIS